MARVETGGSARRGEIDFAPRNADVLKFVIGEAGQCGLQLRALPPALNGFPASIEQGQGALLPGRLR